ncbi:MAG: hypothetical protein K2Y28_08955, partial [Burkholderiaceae bacterium]|nr:hypothetical protein [Burkholderiaceae bacterium]
YDYALLIVPTRLAVGCAENLIRFCLLASTFGRLLPRPFGTPHGLLPKTKFTAYLTYYYL